MNTEKVVAAEEVLRRIATLPAPEGLEERVQARLEKVLRSTPRRSAWRLWMEESLFLYSAPLRAASAVTIAALVLGGGWMVARHTTPVGSAMKPDSASATGGFSTAGAIRVPQTLQGPAVNPSPEVQQNALCAKSMEKAGRQQAKCKTSPAVRIPDQR